MVKKYTVLIEIGSIVNLDVNLFISSSINFTSCIRAAIY